MISPFSSTVATALLPVDQWMASVALAGVMVKFSCTWLALPTVSRAVFRLRASTRVTSFTVTSANTVSPLAVVAAMRPCPAQAGDLAVLVHGGHGQIRAGPGDGALGGIGGLGLGFQLAGAAHGHFQGILAQG